MNLASVQREPCHCCRVSASFFDVLGVKPLIGRTMSPSEDIPGAGKVAVLSESIGAAHAAILPRSENHSLDDEPYVVIGVMPAKRGAPVDRVNVWTPWRSTRGVNPLQPNSSDRAPARRRRARGPARTDVEHLARSGKCMPVRTPDPARPGGGSGRRRPLVIR